MTATPNHALQRTAPRVTLAAADHPAACAHPAPTVFPQPARRAPQSLSLGSFGDARVILMSTESNPPPLPSPKTPRSRIGRAIKVLLWGVFLGAIIVFCSIGLVTAFPGLQDSKAMATFILGGMAALIITTIAGIYRALTGKNDDADS